MKFNTEKFKKYVADSGGAEALAEKVTNNIIYTSFKTSPANNDLIKERLGLSDFNPIESRNDSVIFMLLGLNIADFLIKETVNGKQAIDALFEGKTLSIIGAGYKFKIDSDGLKTNQIHDGKFVLADNTTYNYFYQHEFEVEE